MYLNLSANFYFFGNLPLGEQVKAGLEEWSPGDIEIDRNASAIESSNTSWLLDNSLEATHRRDKRSVYLFCIH